LPRTAASSSADAQSDIESCGLPDHEVVLSALNDNQIDSNLLESVAHVGDGLDAHDEKDAMAQASGRGCRNSSDDRADLMSVRVRTAGAFSRIA
jgi:hypothetical protein